MMKKKSQASFEFLILCGILLFIFLVIIGFYLFRKTEVEGMESYLDLSSECTKFSNIINSVGLSSDGTQVAINTNNILEVYNSSLISISTPLSPKSFDNNVFCSIYMDVFSNSNLTGDVLIENYNGRVLVRNA